MKTALPAARGTIGLIGIALLCYSALAVILTAPLAWHLNQVLGNQIAGADGWQKVYFFWYARYAFEQRTNPLFARLLFAPHGASLALEPVMLPLSTATLPLQYLAGPVVAYNVAALATLALNGLAAQLLALRYARSRTAAFIAGACALASPIAISAIWHGQLEKAIWFPSIAFLLALALLVEQPIRGRRWLLLPLAALLLVGIALVGLYVLLFTAIFSFCFVLAAALRDRARWRAILAAGAAVALLALAPFTLLFGRAVLASAITDDQTWVAISRTQGADLLDLFLPTVVQPARFAIWQYQVWPHAGSWQSSAGFTLLALAAAGLLAAFRQARRFAALAALMLLIGLGATLRVAGHDTGVPLPYRLIEALPGVSISRYPQLALIFTHLMLTVVAALGVAALVRRRPPPFAYGLAGLVCAAVVAEYGFWGVAERSIVVSPVYTRLAALPGSGSVLALPANNDIAQQMVYQMAHGKPIWGGYLARIPPYFEVEHVAILRQLWRNRRERPDVVRYTPDDLRTILRFYGVGYVSFDRSQLDERQYRTLRSIWAQVGDEPPVLADPTTEVYAVPAPAAARPQLLLRLGWWELADGRRWMSEAATLRLINPAGQAAQVAVRLRIEEALAEQVSVLWRGEPLADLELEPQRAGYDLSFALSVPPGEHEIRLTAPARPRQVAGVERQVSIQVSRIELVGAAQ